nr:MAG TPA: hypothetical protein [Caudoviricetes sp.]
MHTRNCHLPPLFSCFFVPLSPAHYYNNAT